MLVVIAAIGLTGWPFGGTALGKSKKQLNIYPNPTSGLLHIDIQDVSGIELFDISGKLVESFEQFPVSTQKLTRGIYLVKVSSPEGIARQKVFVE